MQEDAKGTLPTNIETATFLHHFTTMMGPHGLYQHATIREPLLSEGYCTDDNARAVQMLVRLLPLVSPEEKEHVHQLLMRCWKFITEAEEKPGLYYNFRTAEGIWLAKDRSDDMYARLIRMLSEVLSSTEAQDLHEDANTMLQSLLAHATNMNAPRFWAEFLIAIETLPDAIKNAIPVQNLSTTGLQKLSALWNHYSSPGWPWFEDTMTYANALLPHGMVSGIPTKEYENILHQSADFLLKTTVQDGVFMPIGSNGWYPKGGKPSYDNQQAIEAGTMFDFLLAYNAMFPEKISAENIAAPYLWFFGKNTNHVQMADEKTGACLDGIFHDGPNPNNGAESMLAYQWAEILLRTAPENVQSYISRTRTPLS